MQWFLLPQHLGVSLSSDIFCKKANKIPVSESDVVGREMPGNTKCKAPLLHPPPHLGKLTS